MIIHSSLSDGSGAPQETRRAFTLVEVLVAVAVSAIVFSAIYAGIGNCYNLLQTSRANLRATQIMISELEGIRLCSWGTGTNLQELFNTSVVPTSFTSYFYPLGLNGTTNMGIPYYGTISVTPLNGDGADQTNAFGSSIPYATNMALVTVTVNWTNGLDGKPVAHTRHMSTFVSEYGIANYVINN